MEQPEKEKVGVLSEFLVEDHRRLDGLFQAAVAHPGTIDDRSYAQFRAGLLRHIGMEEKILLPAAQRQRGGEPLPIAAKLRLDHGALASLLMPTPTASILAAIQGILVDHNVLEEGAGGLYETCDALAGPEVEPTLAALRAAPEVTVMPYNDNPAVMNAVCRPLERAGYHLAHPLGNMFIARYQNKPEGSQRRLLPVRDKGSSGIKSRKSGLDSDLPG